MEIPRAGQGIYGGPNVYTPERNSTALSSITVAVIQFTSQGFMTQTINYIRCAKSAHLAS